MKILSLKLEGYRRLVLAQIRYLEYRPNSPFQLILGTNGSGKSSLISELSPLPGDKSDFYKGGYKEIEIDHRGSRYLLTSTFKHGSKHSFIRDGIELNPGGTVLVQKELVLKDFGYTDELHQILTGRLNLTHMVPQKRREWITSLSSADYSYAIGVHKKLMSAARDHLGAARQLKRQLVDEVAKIKALPDASDWGSLIDQLQAELETLLTARVHDDGVRFNLNEIERKRKQLFDRLDTQFRGLTRTSVTPLSRFESDEALLKSHQNLETEINVQRGLSEQYQKEFAELENFVGQFSGDIEVDRNMLTKATQDALDEIEELSGRIVRFRDVQSPDIAEAETLHNLALFQTVLDQLPYNGDQRFSRAQIESTRSELAELKSQRELRLNERARTQGRIQMMETARDLQCPSCKYVWKEGYSQREVDALKQRCTEIDFWLDENQPRIDELTTYSENAEEYLEYFRKFRYQANSFPRLQPLWDALMETGAIYDWPNIRLDLLATWAEDVGIQAEIARKQVKVNELKQALTRAELADSHQHLQRRATQLQELIGGIASNIVKLREELSKSSRVIDAARFVDDNKRMLESFRAEMQALYNDGVEAIRQQAINTAVRELQTQLGSYRHQLGERRTLEGIIEDLERRTRLMEERYESLSLLARALSPNEGVIAEQISGFIKTLVAQMNSVISSIWTYDLAVLPCALEDGDLNYKFPLQPCDGEEPREDIRDGSTAMLDVVNFAFRLTVLLYKGFNDYPLYLDEFSSSFDEQHRVNAMAFVKQLMDNNRHSQLFFVSHYAANNGGFTDPEILVTDDSNIAVSGEYNKHVTIR